VESLTVTSFTMCEGNPVILDAKCEEGGLDTVYIDWRIKLASESHATLELKLAGVPMTMTIDVTIHHIEGQLRPKISQPISPDPSRERPAPCRQAGD